MTPAPLAMSPRNWAQLLLLSVIWGGSFFFIGIAVDSLPPLTIAWLRVAIAALVIGLILLVRGARRSMPIASSPPLGTLVFTFAIMGLANNVVPFSLIAWGQSHIASSLAAILNATTPLFTAIIAHGFLTDERLGARKLAGILLALLGVIVLFDILPSLSSVLSATGAGAGTAASGNVVGSGIAPQAMPRWLAKAAILGAAFCYGIAAVFGRRFQRLGISPLAGAGGQLAASTLWLLPVVALAEAPWRLPIPPVNVIVAMTLLAVVSTAFAYLLYFTILRSAGATNIALVTLLVPVSATALGVLFLGERLDGSQVVGMVLILAGLVVTDGRVFRRRRRPLSAATGV